MQIVKNTNNNISHNTTARSSKPVYICVHATADDGASAKNEVNYFNQKSSTRASADIFCDEDIYFYNNDILNRYCWAVGGRKLKTCGGSMHGIVTNKNSISVEMCCYKDKSGRWCITDQTYISTVYIVKYLMKEYGIPAKNVVRHYDVTGKMCPCVYGFIAENGNDSIWQKMKKDIAGSADQVPVQPKKDTASVKTKLTVDGICGKSTISAMQKFFHTPIDGIISGQYAGFKNIHKGITSIEYGHGGSSVVRALQKWLGVTSDGSLGPATIRAWQRKMNTPIDGVISLPSLLIKEWQKYLNEVM